jgi:hypothetical protein
VLKLRRGRVTAVEPSDERIARLSVRVEGRERAAVAYTALTGPVAQGDEVVVNVEAVDLALGSGGFDVVCVNLTRGLDAGADRDAHVMKLNYTPIQHGVHPVEDGLERAPGPLSLPVAVLALHGQLAPAAFAFAEGGPAARLGYVQTAGGALPGALSEAVADLLERGLLAGHVSVAPCFGAPHEAITVEGALHAAVERLGWDAALVGPAPGILGSASALGHGGLAALANAHSALALGATTLLVPRLSSGDPRERHRGLSHHTRMVLSLLLCPVEVAVPNGIEARAARALTDALAQSSHRALEVDVEKLVGRYLASGLPATTMGRRLEDDQDFLRAGLAGGAAIAAKLADR